MSILFLVLAVFLVISVTAMAVSGAAGRTRLLAISAAALIVLVAGSYVLIGRPDLTKPRAASLEVLQARALAKMDETRAILLRSKIAKVDDWTELANQYWELGSPDKAAFALGEAAKITTEPNERDALLGSQAQALVTANNKRVGADAAQIFEGILGRHPDDLRALFFMGLAAENAGDKSTTQKYWGRLIDIAPKDTPWGKVLRERIGQLGNSQTMPAETAPALQSGPQRDLIESMVARLANRLDTKGGPAAEWAKLGKSYGVLGRRADAQKAYDKALELAPDNADYQRARNALAAQNP